MIIAVLTVQLLETKLPSGHVGIFGRGLREHDGRLVHGSHGTPRLQDEGPVFACATGRVENYGMVGQEIEKSVEEAPVSVIDIAAPVLVVNGCEDRVHPLFAPPPFLFQPIPALHETSSQLERVTNEP